HRGTERDPVPQIDEAPAHLGRGCRRRRQGCCPVSRDPLVRNHAGGAVDRLRAGLRGLSMYPEPTNIWEAIEYSSLGIFIAESTWAFPLIETFHVIALVTVIGTIALVDLRLIGVKGHALRVSEL